MLLESTVPSNACLSVMDDWLLRVSAVSVAFLSSFIICPQCAPLVVNNLRYFASSMTQILVTAPNVGVSTR